MDLSGLHVCYFLRARMYTLRVLPSVTLPAGPLSSSRRSRVHYLHLMTFTARTIPIGMARSPLVVHKTQPQTQVDCRMSILTIS
jgi:hypothetical protein